MTRHACHRYRSTIVLRLSASAAGRIGGTAVFVAALAAQALVLAGYFSLRISSLWYNVVGCAACMLFAFVLQAVLPMTTASNHE